MTPAARCQAAIELLQEIDATTRPADRVVEDYLRQRRYIGGGDRRQVTALVFAQLRRQRRLDWWLAKVKGGQGPRARVIAALLLAEGQSYAEVADLFVGQRYGPAPMSDEEREWARTLEAKSLDHADQPPAVRGETPDWLYERFPEDDRDALLAALLDEAPVDLRVNRLKATRAEAQAALAEAGIETRETPLSPLGLRVEGRVNLAASQPFRDGLVEVQDEGSQIVSLLAGAAPGLRVVDFCAGAGGKTLAMAAEMANKGSIQALDVLKGRIDRSAQRLKRAGVHNVTRRVIKDHRDPWIKRQRKKADLVLVDAPCSGTGAWRRNPDARWNLSAEGLEALIALQAEILESAWRMVKPGGRLVYVTCSLLPEENERQTQAFLAHHGDFAPLAMTGVWSRTFAAAPPEGCGDLLSLRPDRDGVDGFFCAVFQRETVEKEAKE